MLYLVHGDDPHLCVERARALARRLRQADPDADVQTLDAEEHTPEEIVASLTALSLFSPHRIVVVRGAAGKAGRQGRSPREDADADEAQAGDADVEPEKAPASALLRHLQASLGLIPDTTDVIFVETRPLNVRAGLPKLLEAEGARRPGTVQLIRVERPGGHAMESWLADRARDAGIVLDPAAAALMADAFSKDAGGAITELEKLRAYAGPNGRVTADVYRLLGHNLSYSIFQVTDAVAQRNPRLAARALESLVEQGEQPLRIFALIVRQYRILLYLLTGMAAGQSPASALARAGLGLPDGLRRAAEDQAKRLGLQRVRRSYRLLLEADAAIKTGNAEAWAALERVIVELCASDGPVTPEPWQRSAS